METRLERLDPSNVRLTVSLTADEVDAAVREAYSEIARQVKIPGFRSGKVPPRIIDQRVGKPQVHATAIQTLVDMHYAPALDKEGLRPLAAPELDELDDLVEGESYAFTADILVRPHLSLSSTDGLKVEVPVGAASDLELEAQIADARERFATLEPVEDRGVEAGDFAQISFVGTVDGEEYEGNVVEKYLYELGRGIMPATFDEQLLGAKPGDELKVSFTVPETSVNPEYHNKEAAFDVTVHEIKKKILPELDDTFAENAGGFASMDEMRRQMKERLDAAKQFAQARAREQGARAALAERLEGEVPQRLVEKALELIHKDLTSNLEGRQITLEDYLSMTGLTQEQLEEQMVEQAETSTREELALEALFRGEGMEVTDEDLEKVFSDVIASGEGADPAELRAKWEASGVITVVKEQVMHRKAIEWLMGHVEFVERPPFGTVVPAEGDSEAEPKGTPKKKTAKSSAAKKTKATESADTPAEAAAGDEKAAKPRARKPKKTESGESEG